MIRELFDMIVEEMMDDQVNKKKQNSKSYKKSKEDFLKQFSDQIKNETSKKQTNKSKSQKTKKENSKSHSMKKSPLEADSKRFKKSIISQNNETFEERYGTRDHFVDTLYSYSDANPTEVVRTVVRDEDEFKFKDRNQRKSSNLVNRLRSKNTARNAFINSIIFERKI